MPLCDGAEQVLAMAGMGDRKPQIAKMALDDARAQGVVLGDHRMLLRHGCAAGCVDQVRLSHVSHQPLRSAHGKAMALSYICSDLWDSQGGFTHDENSQRMVDCNCAVARARRGRCVGLRGGWGGFASSPRALANCERARDSRLLMVPTSTPAMAAASS